MAKMIRIRKPRLRVTSRGVRVSKPSVRLGGQVGVNISSRGIKPSIHSGRRKKDGCLSLLVLPMILLIGAVMLIN